MEPIVLGGGVPYHWKQLKRLEGVRDKTHTTAQVELDDA